MVIKKKSIVLICILTILLFLGFYNGLVVRKYAVNSNKIYTNDSVRIVLVANLHSCIYGIEQTDIVSLIKKQKPDIIALAGDIADDSTPIDGTKLF